ncbi:heavy metal translocating P-type ATPase [Salinactinospora qingdaonensis]
MPPTVATAQEHQPHSCPRGAPATSRTPIFAVAEARWATVALALFALAATADFLGAPPWLHLPLYAGCYLAGGWEPAWAGLRALRDKTLDVDLLMVIAAAGAAAIGQVFDGALLIVVFATSGALEALATRRTEDSVRGLLDLAPPRGSRLRSDGSEELVAAEDLAVGEEILVRPGERIAADAVVIEGASEVDQAGITGEALPAAKEAGREIFAGTINGTGTLRARVIRPAHDTVVARIVAMVRQASATKARVQLFIERFEQRYSVGVVVATVALFCVPLLLGSDVESALLRAMTFMIVASPCAIVLATMPPLLAAMSTAGRHGVLVKNAVVLERLADTSVVALDKTGTVTAGRPVLEEVRLLGEAPLEHEQVLRLAGAAEYPSEHPLATAIVTASRQAKVTVTGASDFVSLPGRGVTATVDGHRVEVGTADRLAISGPAAQRARTVAHTMTDAGHTAVVVARDGVPVAVLGVRDVARPEAADALHRCTTLTRTPPLLLTGDNAAAAARVAASVGITDVRAGLLPEDKVAAVNELSQRGERVALVGDGVNDAPAMATAHTGIAMGQAGTDVALETADAVVVRDELHAIPTVIALARRARRLVIANLVIAGTVIVGLVTWDLVGTLPLPLGVAGHEGSTVLVALNGLRLLRSKAWRDAQGS